MKDVKEKSTPDIFTNSLTFGYARVSSKTQSLEAQLTALENHGCDKIYSETASTRGKLPELENLIENLRKGDTLIVYKLDRLGRSVPKIINILNFLVEKGVQIKSLTQDIDTTTPMGKMFVYLLAIFAEMERDLISERTKNGLEEARKRGIKGGRPAKLSKRQIKQLKEMHANKIHSISELCEIFKIAKPSIYNYLKKDFNN